GSRDRGGLDARDGAQSLEHGPAERPLRRLVGVAGERQPVPGRDHALRVESRIGRAERVETAKEEPRAEEEQHGEGELGGDEGLPRAPAPSRCRRGGFLQRVLYRCTRRGERGREPEDKPRGDRNHEGEAEYRGIEADLRDAGEGGGREALENVES